MEDSRYALEDSWYEMGDSWLPAWPLPQQSAVELMGSPTLPHLGWPLCHGPQGAPVLPNEDEALTSSTMGNLSTLGLRSTVGEVDVTLSPGLYPEEAILAQCSLLWRL